MGCWLQVKMEWQGSPRCCRPVPSADIRPGSQPSTRDPITAGVPLSVPHFPHIFLRPGCVPGTPEIQMGLSKLMAACLGSSVPKHLTKHNEARVVFWLGLHCLISGLWGLTLKGYIRIPVPVGPSPGGFGLSKG